MAQTCWEVRFNSIFNSILIRLNRHICDQNTMMMETQGLAALFVMWVLCKTTALSRFVGVARLANLGSITIADKPLIVNLGERRVIILGLMVNVSFFLG